MNTKCFLLVNVVVAGCCLFIAGPLSAQTVAAPVVVTTDKSLVAEDVADGSVTRVRLVKKVRVLPIKVTTPEIPSTHADDSDYVYQLTSLSLIGVALSQPQTIGNPDTATPATVPVTLTDVHLNREIVFQVLAVFDVKPKPMVPAASAGVLSRNKRLELTSGPLLVHVDNTPPVADRVDVRRFPGGGGFVKIELKDNDLDPASAVKTAFEVKHKIKDSQGRPINGAGNKQVELPVDFTGEPDYNAATQTVTLNFANLNPGEYDVKISGLKDTVGNPADAQDQTKPFSVPGGRLRGDHIEYPEFLAPKQKETEFDQPGHKVETRVVRLFYYRDARRVVQIINRNVRNLNQVGVDQAQRLAEKAREDAEDRTQERREAEAKAIRAAQKTRATRGKLNEAEAELAKATKEKDRADADKAEAENLINGFDYPLGHMTGGDKLQAYYTAVEKKQAEIVEFKRMNPSATASDPQLVKLEEDLRQLKSVKNRLFALDRLKKRSETLSNRADAKIGSRSADAAQLRTELVTDQQAEVDEREKIQPADAKELRARTEQFRREVGTGLADPDTYASGDIVSIDPVTQVSMSVIGEGVIQLRGPIRGINKVRRMIHQIDVPVGQVKVGIHTIQVNGEHGDRMELVYEEIEKHLAQSRFLANQSGLLVRKAVAHVADQVAAAVDNGYIPHGTEHLVVQGDGQTLRNQRYLYCFFGDDFIGELQEMDSELLNTENKMLSLHSMDTLGLSGALMVTALADHPIRLAIVQEFQRLVACELPQREAENYRSLTKTRHANPTLNKILTRHFQGTLDRRDEKRIWKNAARTYNFASSIGFFNNQLHGNGTLNSMQFAVIRLAQSLKAQLVSEMEYRNLLLEKSLLEKNEDEIPKKMKDAENKAARALEKEQKAKKAAEDSLRNMIKADIDTVVSGLFTMLKQLGAAAKEPEGKTIDGAWAALGQIQDPALDPLKAAVPRQFKPEERILHLYKLLNDSLKIVQNEEARTALETLRDAYAKPTFAVRLSQIVKSHMSPQALDQLNQNLIDTFLPELATGIQLDSELAEAKVNFAITLLGLDFKNVTSRIPELEDQSMKPDFQRVYEGARSEAIKIVHNQIPKLRVLARRTTLLQKREEKAENISATAKEAAKKQESLLFAQRVLNQSLDEKEEQAVELLEAMRSHTSNVDNYLKRLAIALEDDINAQFYNPAFQQIRRASRYWDVSLGQIETTTILTNNRTFAKVSPAASFEFDLPHRDLLITEAFKGAKALSTEYGNLMQDGTFLAAGSMLSGQPAAGLVGSQSPIQQIPGLPPSQPQEFGAALQALIPEPSVFKIETGTGFEIKPVIQPDGYSIVYNFNYTYTTNVREPVRADEKHLGRVKRHFVHTDVQTSSYELREVSRYTVALKASRTSRGVPLFEDIPLAGALFRPLPSAESSLQENIILASSVIYPTLYDLMGLRWSPYADEIASTKLKSNKYEAQMRRTSLQDTMLQRARDVVDQRAGLLTDCPPQSCPPKPNGQDGSLGVDVPAPAVFSSESGPVFLQPRKMPAMSNQPGGLVPGGSSRSINTNPRRREIEKARQPEPGDQKPQLLANGNPNIRRTGTLVEQHQPQNQQRTQPRRSLFQRMFRRSVKR